MKYWTLIALLGLASSMVFAQETFDLPAEGAQIHLSDYELEMEASEEMKMDVWVVRSKKAKKAKFDAPKFLGSGDLEISVAQDAENLDHYIATIKTNNLTAGKYFYTVSSRSRSIQKVKGTTVSFTVGSANAVTKNE